MRPRILLAIVALSVVPFASALPPALHAASLGWPRELVRTFPGGSAPPLELDTSGNPHILACPPGEVWYYTRQATGWTGELVAQTVAGGVCGKLALDQRGVPHITVPPRSSDPGQMYATKVGGSWIFTPLPFPAGDLELGPSSTPAIVDVGNFPEGGLRYARLGASWIVEDVDDFGSAVTTHWEDLAYDALGNPHILYYDEAHGAVKYASRDAGGWHIETVEDVGFIEFGGKHGSLAIAADGTAHGAYLANVSFDMNRASLRHAVRTAGIWHTETIDQAPGMKGFFPTIMLTRSRVPRIGFQNWGQTGADLDLRYATFDGTSWTIETAYDAAALGVQFPDFALDACDRPHAAFFSNDEGGVVYASRDDPCTSSRGLSLRVEPDTLNLKSKGNWVTGYLYVQNASSTDIDPARLSLNGIAVSWFRVLTNETLVAKFDRSAFAATLRIGTNVVTLAGQWRDGGAFATTDVILVIRPGT